MCSPDVCLQLNLFLSMQVSVMKHVSFHLRDNVGYLIEDEEAVRTCSCVQVWFLYTK